MVDEASERYRLESRLGQGGMGEVLRAYDTRLERYVALKLLPVTLSQDEQYVARFKREAQIAARIDEPHVVPIYDFGTIDDRLFIAMRLVEGSDVGLMLKDGPLAANLAAQIVAQVAAALDAAHKVGLIHRDIKPSNIMVTKDQVPFAYLMDFGVAVQRGQSGNLTESGVQIGTMNYMAPETFEGAGPLPSADIYGLGCVLYEMLVARRPFDEEDIPAVMYSHLHKPPPLPSQRDATLPRALDDVVARAMAKSPDERFATAGELGRAALDAALDVGTPSGASRGTPPGSGYATSETSAPDPTGKTPNEPPPSPDPTRITRPPPRPSFDILPPRVGHIPLRADYQTNAGPLRHGATIPFLNNQIFVDIVRQRLQYSPGGSLLVSGLNGVGKTTVVHRAVDELRRELVIGGTEEKPVLAVWQSVARPTTPEELLVRLIRGLGDAVQRAGIVDRLTNEVEETLATAYRRTMMTVKTTRSETLESSLGLTGTLGGFGGNAGGKKARARGDEEQFLPYGLVESEHDFPRIVSALTNAENGSHRPARRWFGRAPRLWTGRLVFVLDEIDKLTSDADGLSSLETLLRGLKNIFTASAAHFVFVAGADVFDLCRRAYTRSNTIWSTVFGRQIYINCLPPGTADALLRHLLLGIVGRTPTEISDYLEYRSRGLPRLLLNSLDELVEWRNNGPHLFIDPPSAASIAFFATLQRRLGPLWAQARPRGPLTDPIDIDNRRNATYLVVDWVLSKRGAAFTAEDLITERAEQDANTDLASDRDCIELLNELANVGVLDAKGADSPRRTVVGAGTPTATTYQLARTIMDTVQSRATEAGELGRIGDGRYILVEELGRGPLGTVYLARDRHTGRDVAIKVLDVRSAGPDEDLVGRFHREVDIARSLDHPLLATVLAAVNDDGQLALVSEYVRGRSLATLVAQGPLHPTFTVHVGKALADLLGYLDQEDVVRLALKPSNIVVTSDGSPVLVDLGLARSSHTTPLTRAGSIIGTPLYLAPEQLTQGAVDIASDLFALGLVLFEMLTGRPARQGDVRTIVESAATERIDVSDLACSPQFKTILSWLLEPNVDDRCKDPKSLAAHLASVPEMMR
ncbi:protein kinase [Actinomycetospora rhizophila]|uniref:non-specific serine/threonine protein kinase n=1 Tax=Actinomycetospora rhizophila TaxID=1416876 RepID=A0ABV9Z9A2_9PSEU